MDEWILEQGGAGACHVDTLVVFVFQGINRNEWKWRGCDGLREIMLIGEIGPRQSRAFNLYIPRTCAVL
ncbi:hypothetical protein Hypma_003949 [Hypsizygus marmoreus]|uniref:Uncharacterized protein n=1 Tax=Hypsizygus marmoreus TaxID=39966 RepID=A0A369J7M1_HYPMA|nr:hypothetical protein Hypma_003949 [Hypsizygus marmoreus]